MVRVRLHPRCSSAAVCGLLCLAAVTARAHVGAHGKESAPTAEAIAAAGNQPTPLLRGKALYEVGAMERARAELDAALGLEPTSAVALRYRAMVHAHERRFAQAFADFDAALALPQPLDDMLQALYFSGDAYFNAGIHDKAASRFEALLARKPDHVDARCYLGEVRFKQGRKADAAAAFRKALAVDAKSAWAQHSLADALAQLGQVEEAIAAYRADLALVPHCQTARANLAIVLEQQGRVAEALRELYTSLAYHPGDAAAHTAMGRLFLVQGEPLRAYAEYARAIEFAPRHEEAARGLREAKHKVEAMAGAASASRELVFWRFVGWWLPAALFAAGLAFWRSRRRSRA